MAAGDGATRAGGGNFIRRNCGRKTSCGLRCKRFSTIEINRTFYSLQTTASFMRWAEETPEDFVLR